MQDFKQLNVWRKSHDLALFVYKATRLFPDEERYGLTSQMRRAATSIPTNIAEGCGRGTRTEFKQFLYISMGSASELEYHILLARDLGLLTEAQSDELGADAREVKRMLSGLIQSLKASHSALRSGR
jgi:four helix bundle protein